MAQAPIMRAGRTPSLRPFAPGEYITNPDGSYSTERTVTVQDRNGQWMNVPSLWKGPDGATIDMGDDEDRIGAALGQYEAGGAQFSRFPTVDDAVRAAEARSSHGGAFEGSGMATPDTSGANGTAMANPWDNDPIVIPAGASSEAPWENDPIIEAAQTAPDAINNLAYGEVPAGMVLDPETGRMMDTKAMANALPNRAVFSAPKGIPFIGEWFDEVVGMGDPVKTAVAREAASQFERENPKTATGLQLATGATAIPAAVMAGGAVASTLPQSLAARSAAGLFGGVTGGFAEGAVSGYGEGTDPESRAQRAGERGAIGATVGGGVGLVAPAIASGIGKVGRYALDRMTTAGNARAVGMTPQSARILNEALDTDQVFSGPGAQRLAASGPDAMIADAGSATQGLLDLTIQKGGKGANLASLAVQKRASDAANRLRGTMDFILGAPEGLNKSARDIAKRTAGEREFLYKAAYGSPINYASEAGKKVEDVFSRTPPSILRAAISEANDAMLVAGERNMQILADIAEDGSVAFRQMPNVRQVDELKKALGSLAAKEVDQFGRPTGVGLRVGKLGRELRDAAVEAVPVYGKAVQLGGDKIAEDNALRLGNTLLSPSVTREAVRDATNGMTTAERKQLMQGLRQHIDDTMANVSKVISDPNLDAREATKVWRDLSSKASREKVTDAIGESRAKALFAELDRAEAALGLRASVAANSKTFARQNAERQVKDIIEPGPIGTAAQGKPFNAFQRGMQALTGQTPEDMLRRERVIYEDIANVLTGPRGPDATRTLSILDGIRQQDPRNSSLSTLLGQTGAGAVAVPGYQEGQSRLESLIGIRRP